MAQQDFSKSAPPGNESHPSKTAKIVLTVILLIGVSVAFYQVVKGLFPHDQNSGFAIRDWVSLKGGSEADAVPFLKREDKQEIRIAVAPIVSPEKSMEMYDPFVDYVGAKLGKKPTALYRPTYSETNDLVRYQRCDIAIVCTYPFIRGEREFGMQPLVVPQMGGETTYQSVILIPQTSSARTILDLRGKRFASADIMSTTCWLFPAILLMDLGENPDKFFGEHILTGSHDRSLQAIVDGFVEGAAVHGIVYEQMIAENPSITGKVKVLATSGPFGIPPIAVHPDLDPGLREAILRVLLKMHEDPEGRSILAKLQIERYVIPDADLFAPLRQAVSKLEKWR